MCTSRIKIRCQQDVPRSERPRTALCQRPSPTFLPFLTLRAFLQLYRNERTNKCPRGESAPGLPHRERCSARTQRSSNGYSLTIINRRGCERAVSPRAPNERLSKTSYGLLRPQQRPATRRPGKASIRVRPPNEPPRFLMGGQYTARSFAQLVVCLCKWSGSEEGGRRTRAACQPKGLL